MDFEANNIIFAADLHIAERIWASKPGQPEICGDAYYSWNQIVEYTNNVAMTRGSTILVLGGDVFNVTRPSSKDISVFANGIAKLLVNNVNVFYIQGQHERSDVPWIDALNSLLPHGIASGIGGGIFHIDRRIITLHGNHRDITLAGFDYRHQLEIDAELQKLIDNGVQPNILVLHQAIRGISMIPGLGDISNELLATIRPDLILAGDIHQPIGVRMGETFIYYTGASYMCRSSEVGDKYFIHIHADKWDSLPIETPGVFDHSDRIISFVKLKIRPTVICRASDVSDLHNLDERLQNIELNDLKPLVMLYYDPNAEVILDEARRIVGDKAYLWYGPIHMTDNNEEVDDIGQNQTVTMNLQSCIDDIIQELNLSHQQLVRDFVVNLIQSDEPSDIIRSLRAQLVAE